MKTEKKEGLHLDKGLVEDAGRTVGQDMPSREIARTGDRVSENQKRPPEA